MNSTTWNTKILSSLAMALLLVACKSTPLVDKPAAVEDKSPGQTSAGKPAATTGADTSAVKELNVDGNATDNGNNPLKDPNNILSQRTIYFDFDSDAVKAEFRPLIEAHAKYLLANGTAKVIVQGNTDARGTREYNLSLGQRRSVAIKKSLNLLGVQDAQIETVSYGEEKADEACADESCYKTNRRADIVYGNE
ncbi:MAG: peptidoglycan-associated lipoprotein Pal [Methylotenera sp.]|uniref:peptidoglycan-associated lipoprotein Pal n=1 Tax=Methylotenera sp. TaxID=2051956 RepID=UPI0017D92236|nr:peptidoglycan-associated lipoprotein Pal [Methylotenera sp.]NOU26098.1 peptidoglycan-associated lipoprotein Pal [Methylotenera sp.]